MSTVTYPSDVVPGPPRIALEMPPGWEQIWAPDTLVAIRQAGASEHFAANVVVRFLQRVAPFGGEEIHAELSRYAQGRRDGQVGPLKSQSIGGREWLGADVAFVDDQAGTIGQVHWFTAQERHGVLDLIQVTGSYAGARRESDYPTIDAIVDSVRLNP